MNTLLTSSTSTVGSILLESIPERKVGVTQSKKQPRLAVKKRDQSAGGSLLPKANSLAKLRTAQQTNVVSRRSSSLHFSESTNVASNSELKSIEDNFSSASRLV